MPSRTAANGLDVRFMVNTIAPYVLTRRLLPLLSRHSRVINLSSAAQAPVHPDALAGKMELDDSSTYAQSKLALTMWSNHLANELSPDGPMIVAVNPGSFLGTKMVQEAYGTSGSDISIGADISCGRSDSLGLIRGGSYVLLGCGFGRSGPDSEYDDWV